VRGLTDEERYLIDTSFSPDLVTVSGDQYANAANALLARGVFVLASHENGIPWLHRGPQLRLALLCDTHARATVEA
jgi:hypothetical protein